MTLPAIRHEETGIVAMDPGIPREMISFYTEVANQLSAVVEAKNLYSMISGKKHLSAEAWQTVVSLDGANPIIEYCNSIEIKGEVVAWESKARIEKNGELLATGIMVCGTDDFPCTGKTGFAQARAGMSASQTWAIAKAARGKYAWVVTLAGYSPTPADEMNENAQSSGTVRQSKGRPRKKSAAEEVAEHFCGEHEVGRNKDSKGRWYHKYGDNYCIEGAGLLNADGEPVEEREDFTEDVEDVVEGQATFIEGEDDHNPMEAH